MLIQVRVATEPRGEWRTFAGLASAEAVKECYALPKSACRGEFWSNKLGVNIPKYRALIWTIVHDED